MTAPAEGHAALSLSRGRLALLALGGFVLASLITVCAVLPAEFHLDPTGVGAAAGLMSLSAAPEAKSAAVASAPGQAAPAVMAREYPAAFRSDVIDIPLKAGTEEGSEVEYKVHMLPGATMIYSWSVAAPPEEFYTDFHSEQRPSPKENVVSHKAGLGVSGNGSLVAPFEGIHGWYWQNQSLKPVVVRLKISGFYDLLPGGKPPA